MYTVSSNRTEQGQTLPEDHTSKLDDEPVLMGYVQDFRDPDSIDYSSLSHVVFSFAHPEKDGSLTINDEMMVHLRKTVQHAKQEDTKVLLAVGGAIHVKGGSSYEYFKTAIKNPDSRLKLIEEIITTIEKENLDGVDIDFEHPRSKEDAHYLAAFTQALGEQLQSNDKELSIAVHAKVHSETGDEVKEVVYDSSMFQHVDYVNIMAYDGQWDSGYNAENLSPYPFAENVVNYWSSLFDKHGISKSKLVLGVPSYAQPENENDQQISYNAVIENGSAYAERDSIRVNGTTYHYNGKETVRKKTNLALDSGFGGMMLWEIGHDAEGTHSLTSIIHREQRNRMAD
ncbi:Chitinase, GH18 family [Alteribacillus persepolensis]|uniref:chitinase n=1 Tax=Alteribacillus persepolensis TaxID=568899 RepID=A0A1G8GW19_9BACI|nr:glycoside hydrolase family 18 protein [Alteribacillus persepolensis]SDH98594.1 Chitinase, GH18 family [Alteribacillus persepolensis]